MCSYDLDTSDYVSDEFQITGECTCIYCLSQGMATVIPDDCRYKRWSNRDDR